MILALSIFAALFLILWGVRRYVVSVNYINSGSMEPTLLIGDIVLGKHWGVEAKRGDIVLFKHEGKRCIKRIAGAMGDKVAMYGGRLCIVPSKHFFLLGDNREASMDSRFYGPIPQSEVLGIAIAVLGNIKDKKRGTIKL